ncbi:AMP-binding protein, partial [Streptomyces sp. MCAF7]
MLAFQNNAAAKLELPGLEGKVGAARTGKARFDLAFDLAEEHTDAGAPGGIAGRLEYSADLFTEETARTLAARLAHLLDRLTATPDGRLAETDALLPGERERLLVDWNGAPAHPAEPPLYERFQARVAATPDHPALLFEDRRISYRELNERANRLARALVARGAGPDGLVAIALPRSPEMVVAALAVLKSGAAYLPIDPAYPADRIGYMAEDARPVLALTDREVARAVPGLAAVPQLLLDDPEAVAEIAALPADDLRPHERRATPSAGHTAYVIYTSGSTGRPKGV